MGVDKAKAPFYVLFYYHLLSFHSLILCSNFHDMVIDNCLKLEVSYVIPQGLSSNDITHYKTLYTLLIVSNTIYQLKRYTCTQIIIIPLPAHTHHTWLSLP